MHSLTHNSLKQAAMDQPTTIVQFDQMLHQIDRNTHSLKVLNNMLREKVEVRHKRNQNVYNKVPISYSLR